MMPKTSQKKARCICIIARAQLHRDSTYKCENMKHIIPSFYDKNGLWFTSLNYISYLNDLRNAYKSRVQ